MKTLCLLLAAVSLVAPIQAPHNYTSYEFLDDAIAQCVEDAECGTDTECVDAEDRCIIELTSAGGRCAR